MSGDVAAYAWPGDRLAEASLPLATWLAEAKAIGDGVALLLKRGA